MGRPKGSANKSSSSSSTTVVKFDAITATPTDIAQLAQPAAARSIPEIAVVNEMIEQQHTQAEDEALKELRKIVMEEPVTAKSPARGRSKERSGPSNAKAPASGAHDLRQRIILQRKVSALLKVRPVLRSQFCCLPIEASLESHEALFLQVREATFGGREVAVLTKAIQLTTRLVESQAPWVASAFPEYAHLADLSGFSDEVSADLDRPNSDLHDAVQLCAVDLIGYVDLGPWSMLALSLFDRAARTVSQNHRHRMDAQNLAGMQSFAPDDLDLGAL